MFCFALLCFALLCFCLFPLSPIIITNLFLRLFQFHSSSTSPKKKTHCWQSTQYTPKVSPTRLATYRAFADLPRVKALGFKFDFIDSVQLSHQYNSDVTRAVPFTPLTAMETGVFYALKSDFSDTGKLLAPGQQVGTLQRVKTELPHTPKMYLRFLLTTVGTEPTAGYLRFLRSCHMFGMPFRVFGMGQHWEGGTMKITGGGHKVNLLREGLDRLEEELWQKDQLLCAAAGGAGADGSACLTRDQLARETIIMFSDSYDVVLAGPPSFIVSRFQSMNLDILFSGELFIWPLRELADQFPKQDDAHPFHYLNSGGFMGSMWAIRRLLEIGGPINNTDDDQAYYTLAFLKIQREFSHELRIRLDDNATIFQVRDGCCV